MKCIEDEIPFDVPDGWAWCRLSDLFNVCSAKRVLQSEWRKEGIPFYRAREIVKLSNNGYVDNDLFISEEHYQSLKKSYGVPQAGDLMVTGVGTIGKVYIVQENDIFYYKDASVLCFKNRHGVILSEYARIMIDSTLLQNQIHSKTYGNTVDTITISTANKYMCVLPPIKEQRRIINSVKSIAELILTIEDSKSELSDIVIQAKSKILDLAIRGKLVPQNPDDEPASVLLERIRAEKEELIKQGKIKRDKKESVIFKGEDNSYYEKIDDTTKKIDSKTLFEIPENWHWEKLGNICTIARGGSPRPIDDYLTTDENGINWIKIGDAEQGGKYIHHTKEKIKPEGLCKTRQVKTGDFLLTNSMSFGRPYILKTDGCIHDGWLVIGDIKNVFDQDFLYYALSSDFMYNSFAELAAGSTVKNLKSDTVRSVLFPVPPLQEQKRISQHLDKLFYMLTKIEQSLN